MRLYGRETGSGQDELAGLFRRTLELSFLLAPAFRAISDRRSTTRPCYITEITSASFLVQAIASLDWNFGTGTLSLKQFGKRR